MRSIFLITLLFLSHNAAAEVFSTFEDVVGKELLIQNNWAGESFTLLRNNGELSVCHSIFGSGIAVISRTLYPVKKVGERKASFFIDGKDTTKKGEFNFLLSSEGELALFYNGYKLAPLTVSPDSKVASFSSVDANFCQVRNGL